MKFKITSITKNKEQLVHYYDNITQDIFTEKGIPIILKNDPRCSNLVVPDYSPSNKDITYITNTLKELRIQVGLNCNFHCKYCNQRFEQQKDKNKSFVKLPDSVRVRNFIKLLKEKNIQPQKIVFWGGEPFVYFKLLKILVPALKELYPTTVMSTISNGSLINKEIIDFLLENRIALTISHDAFGFNAYRDDKDPLDNPEIVKEILRYKHEVERIGKYKELSKKRVFPKIWFGINVVITPANADVSKIDEYFKKKLGESVHWHFESVVKLDCDSKNIIKAFTDEQKKLVLTGLFEKGIKSPKDTYDLYRDQVSGMLMALINKINANNVQYPCDVTNNNVLATTIDGDILACHGASKTDFTVGYLKDFGKVKNTKCIPWSDREDCYKCPYVAFCRGACSIMSNEDVKISCENLQLWKGSQFICSWYLLFNSIIQKIELVEE